MAVETGVLALQGGYAAHARMLEQLGCRVREVRSPGDLRDLAALCMPGGESTTMSLLLDTSGLREPLRAALAPTRAGGGGLPVLATCAGLILLAERVRGDSGSRKVESLGLLDATVNRNSFGRQVDSFETELKLDWNVLGGRGSSPAAPAPDAAGEFHGVFIRAPRIEALGAAQAAGWLDDEPVLVRQENLLGASFHPELGQDTRLHEALLRLAGVGT